jgi:hypothetical protein
MGRDFADPGSSMLVDLAIAPVEWTGIISSHVLSALFHDSGVLWGL